MATQKQERDDTAERRQMRERFDAIIGRLDKEAEERVGKRDLVEKRWLADIAQYHGNYTDELITELKNARKSTLFINSTRPKTNTMASRLADMLFPTDERNWGIEPTPVPELTVEAEDAARAAAETKMQAASSPDDPKAQAAADEAHQRAMLVEARMDEAKKRARSMEEEIDDHLREGHYAAQARDVIEDGCKLGTGIMKGPVVGDRSRRSWQQQEVDDGEGNITSQFVMADVKDKRPVFWRVDPWNFFPDMDARSIEDAEGVFERHLMNKKQLRRLARNPGFDKDAIRSLLIQGPDKSIPHYIADLRSITGQYHDATRDRFHVWEYHGPLSQEDMRDLAVIFGKEELLDDMSENGDIDPLQEIEAVAWFCQGQLLKFGLHHLDSGDSIYSVFNLEKDDSSVFGFGVPYIMRDPQKAMASAWRTLMDNAGLSSGPQIVINKNIVEPQNGVWTLEPRKIWIKKQNAPKGEKAFETFNVDSHMEELTALIELCKKNVDEETNLPLIAQGEQGTHVTKTAHGMSLLMNSVNVVFRRIVKNWDDDLTTPTIRRMYDWLMQFSPKEHIKGDYEVDARGSSVLLVREMQSANLMVFLMNFAGHAVLGKYLKKEGLPALRRLVQTMMIPSDDVIKSNEEVAQDEARAAEQPPPPDPEMEKIAAQLNLETMRGRNALTLEGARRETALITLASKNNMELDKLKAMLADHRAERESDERKMAAEAAVTARIGPTGGGSF